MLEEDMRRILLIDDDKDIGDLLMKYSEQFNLNSIYINNGREGREYIREHYDDLVGVISDEDMPCPHGMPEIKGHQVAEYARAFNYTGPFMIYTGRKLKEFEQSRLEGLGICYGSKPDVIPVIAFMKHL